MAVRSTRMMIDGGAEAAPVVKTKTAPDATPNPPQFGTATPWAQAVQAYIPPAPATSTTKPQSVFTPVKEIVDRYGTVVRVDAQGRDESGNIVFAGSDQSAVGGPANTSMIVDAGNGQTLNLTQAPISSGPTTARAILESMLRDAGIPSDMLQASVNYLEQLDQNGIDDPNDMIDIYMNNKTFTTKSGAVLNSPFYAKYTALGENVKNPATGKPYSAKDLFAWRTGVEDVISRYQLSDLFKGEDVLKKLVANNRSVKNLEEDAQAAVLAEVEADPNKLIALQKMGYLKAGQGLRNFYLNPDIGQQQLEKDKSAAAFATEAVRFATSGIQFNPERIKQIAAAYGNQPESAAALSANQLYTSIAETLQPTVARAGMYAERPSRMAQTMPSAREMVTGIQTELENEFIYKLESQLRKRTEEQNRRAFQGQAGTAIGAQGLLSQRGIGTAGLL